MRMLKIFGALAIAGTVSIALLLCLLWLEHRSELTLPAPTGPFAVGRMTFDWADDTALDTLAPKAGTKRELLVWIWYPAQRDPSAAPAQYWPAELKAASQRPAPRSVMNLLTRDWSKVRPHSVSNAPVAPGQAFPVVIMRAGASASVINYSTLAEDLASHGYVVAGIDAPYRTGRVVFPDGRVIERTPENDPERFTGEAQIRMANKLLNAWTSDIAFTVDRLSSLSTTEPKFAGRLDMARVGVFGHSFGGAQAAQFCSQDSRCKTGIDIDGAPLGSVVQTGLRQPFMFLLSDHGDASDPDSRRIMSDIQSIYDRLPRNGRQRVMIRGANHFTFSDDGALLKSRLMRGLLRLFGKLHISGRRQLAASTYCIHTFFDACLKTAANSRPEISSPSYPEIIASRP